MKTLKDLVAADETMELYCGLFATATALRKLGDTEGRAEWCEAWAEKIKAKFLTEEKASESPWGSKKHPGRPMSPEQCAENEKLGLYD